MNAPKTLYVSADRELAYHKLNAQGDGASAPGLIFLGGFRSDMTGAKAMFLQNWAEARGLSYLRFDCRGHGASSGVFEEGCVGDWAEDAAEVLQRLTKGPQILVGSSMGGWIALLLARRFPDRIAGLVGVAAAPDFTQRRWLGFTTVQQQEIEKQGYIALVSAYDDAPYLYTLKLFEDGRKQEVLDQPLVLPFPVRLLHGTADPDVPYSVSVELLEHATCEDARLTLVKGGDHRLSSPENLRLLGKTIDGILRS